MRRSLRLEGRQIDAARDFTQGGAAVEHASDGVLRKRASALLRRETAQFAQGGPPRDQFVEIGIEAYDFHQRDPPVVSLLITILAAAGLVQRLSAGGVESKQAPLGGIRMIGFLAAAAQAAYQPLSDHTDQIAGEDFRVQSQI